MTYAEHESAAREKNQVLAAITSAIENERVGQIAGNQSVYIGGIRLGSGNGPTAEHWRWSSGDDWSFTNWTAGEPNNCGGKEDRVQLYKNKTWNDVAETWKGPAVYMDVPQPVGPAKTYHLATSIMTYAEHESAAREKNQVLAAITSASENARVCQIAGNQSVYIGGIRQGTGNGPTAEHWRWSSGWCWSYTNWDTGQPDNYKNIEDRAQMWGSKGKWNDVQKDWKGPAVYMDVLPDTQQLQLELEKTRQIAADNEALRLQNPSIDISKLKYLIFNNYQPFKSAYMLD